MKNFFNSIVPHRYNFLSQSGGRTVWARCDSDAVRKMCSIVNGEAMVSVSPEGSTWTIDANNGPWTLFVPRGREIDGKEERKAKKRLQRALESPEGQLMKIRERK